MCTYKSVEEMMAILTDDEIYELGRELGDCYTHTTWKEAKYMICEDYIYGKPVNTVED